MTLVRKRVNSRVVKHRFIAKMLKGFPTLPPLTQGIHTATRLERCSPCIYHEQRNLTKIAQNVGRQTQMVS